MLNTYKAILHEERVEWIDRPPKHTHPVEVQITLLEEETLKPSPERGLRMKEALTFLAAAGAFSDISDPVVWQRKERNDRSLPYREP